MMFNRRTTYGNKSVKNPMKTTSALRFWLAEDYALISFNEKSADRAIVGKQQNDQIYSLKKGKRTVYRQEAVTVNSTVATFSQHVALSNDNKWSNEQDVRWSEYNVDRWRG